MKHGGKREGAGRKAGAPNKVGADVRALAQQYTDKAIKRLAHLMDHAESEVAQARAAEVLLDRGHGKSLQRTEGELTVNLHDGARDKLRNKLDRFTGREPAPEPLGKPH